MNDSQLLIVAFIVAGIELISLFYVISVSSAHKEHSRKQESIIRSWEKFFDEMRKEDQNNGPETK